MKVLYAFQGTGNGHSTRAAEIIPVLKRKARVDVLISGTQSDLKLPFPIDYALRGLSFTFGRSGGIDYIDTFKKMDSSRLLSDIREFPVEKYDLIINDFEPVSAWAARSKMIPCVSLSHQSAVLHPLAPKPGTCSLLGRFVLEHYAPSHFRYGFHFKSYDNGIYTPVIRDKVRDQKVSDKGHYVVYLPAFTDERIIRFLSNFSSVNWCVFSKKTRSVYKIGNMEVHPISDDLFVERMASCSGVLCGAGFETPAEALFLGKKVMAIPMRGQYEQKCNAKALEDLGVEIIYDLHPSNHAKVRAWLERAAPEPMAYPKHTERVIEDILDRH
ncbi:MAG: glycosyl transferase [Flavobacteriales bacterium]|nr:glycosyl transferase [Flavobacteriales bacterium]